ncbi:unnamed protein product, partial [marine sediment metagenome]
DVLSGLDLELASWPAIAFDETGKNVKWLHPVIQVQD